MTAPETIIDRNREIVRKIYEIADRGAGTEHEQYMAEHGQFMSADSVVVRTAAGGRGRPVARARHGLRRGLRQQLVSTDNGSKQL